MPDILAAIGRVQLSRAEQLLKIRLEIAEHYNEGLKNNKHFTIPGTFEGNAMHLYPLMLNLETLKISRNEFIEQLQNYGIGVSVHFIPLHIMPYYKKKYRIMENALPCSVQSYLREISLPIWPGMSREQIEKVIKIVNKIAKKHNKK